MLLWDREVALRDLMLTFRAKTLSDAATQLFAGFLAAEDLMNFELPPEDRDRKATAVRRALLSAIPVVAEAAGLDLTLIGGEYTSSPSVPPITATPLHQSRATSSLSSPNCPVSGPPAGSAIHHGPAWWPMSSISGPGARSATWMPCWSNWAAP
jgi:hypothetical protein